MPHESKPSNKKKVKNLKPVVMVAQQGIQMLVAILLFALLGNYLDTEFNAGGKAYTLICIFSGLLIAIYLLVRPFIKKS
jgi:hypothetical protein